MNTEYAFQKLTPVKDVELGVYESAMEYVYANEDIRNIAISGNYGSGKSSMLESYAAMHQDRHFLHISLAHFEEQEVTEKDEKQKDNQAQQELGNGRLTETVLEGKILNQLIHQIKPEDVEQTNFRIKRDIDGKSVGWTAAGTMLFVMCICFLCFNGAWCSMVRGFSMPFLTKLLAFTTTREAELAAGMIALGLASYAAYKVIWAQKNRKILKKLSVQGNEIEIFEDAGDSYFDRYMNEILYLLEHTEADSIVFEDIDRYDSGLIFEKLREINCLSNRRRESGIAAGKNTKRLPLRFFYLLRDDIFVSKDRTKFFDFIIPIVPVVNTSNAYDKLREYFEAGNLLQLFDEKFLKGLSLYIDDIRILKNIYNEFVVYYERFKQVPTGRKPDKLLAMIAYKNIFPKDFGELQACRGYVYTIFSKREEFRQKELGKLQEQIDVLVEENRQLEGELCKSLEELQAIYFVSDERLSVDDKEEGAYASRAEFVKAVLQSRNVKKFRKFYNDWANTGIINEKQKLERNAEYQKRKKRIEEKEKGKIGHNNRELAYLKIRTGKVNTARLQDLITRENAGEIFSVHYRNEIGEEEKFEDIKRNPYFPLIKYLISGGYIDETYQDYMTYFYENSISRKDKAFLRSVTDKEALPFAYHLTNLPAVIDGIRMTDFEEEEVFNFDLLDYLLEHAHRYKEQLEQFLKGIWNYEPVTFVAQYLERSSRRMKFTEEFNKSWEGACYWILTTDGFGSEVRRRYITDTLCVSAKEVVEANNEKDIIVQYIENEKDFLNVEEEQTSAFIQGLEKLSVKFAALDCARANKQALAYVYKNNRYQLNAELIDDLLEYEYGIDNPANNSERQLSMIFSMQEEPLCRYVKENLDEYLTVLLQQTKQICDEEDAALFVINSDAVSKEHKLQYISAMQTVLSDVKSVTDMEFWPELMKQGRFERNNMNILDYYYLTKRGLDEELVSFINSFEGKVSFSDEQFGDHSKDAFFWNILGCNQLQDEKYESILSSLNLICANFKQEGISGSKMNILIMHGIIQMKTEEFAFMRKKYPECCAAYVERNLEKYINMMLQDAMESEPSLFTEEDLKNLTDYYPKAGSGMRAEIAKVAVASIDELIKVTYLMDSTLLGELMQADAVTESEKKLLLAGQAKCGLSENKMREILTGLQLMDFLSLLDGKRPKIAVTASNKALLDAFLIRDWISSFEEDAADGKYYRAYGRKRRLHF